MEIKIHSAVQIDKQFEDYVAAKAEKLRRFIFDEGTAELYIKKEGPEYISEISIHTKHFTIFLKEVGNDLNSSIEILFDKAKIKLRKTHDKIIDKSHK
jgi:ribosomal subunit interface protein